MATPRKLAIGALTQGQMDLDRHARDVPDDEAEKRATIGGGEWSLKDLIGHIAHWEELALETISRARKEEAISRVALNDVDDENARDVERKARWPVAKVRQEAEATHRELLRQLEEMSDEDWERPRPTDDGGERSLGDMLGSVLGAPNRPFGHVSAHLEDLKSYASSLR
jgi:uncharacterized damage-inducible protein DinB